ncbi:MAG: rhodanese-like domain-containing protein [Turicibacter sp.]|nr:rhodanese-like domain-containing protein [Turicibacter sp.]
MSNYIEVPSITPEELKVLIKRDEGLVVDVREEYEYMDGHIEDSINIPTSVIVEEFRQIPKDKNVFIICEHGVRSHNVAYFLKDMGYEKVINVSGGMSMWDGAICL